MVNRVNNGIVFVNRQEDFWVAVQDKKQQYLFPSLSIVLYSVCSFQYCLTPIGIYLHGKQIGCLVFGFYQEEPEVFSFCPG